MKQEKPIESYDFSSKREGLNKILNTPDYQEYKANKKKIQKRKETAYKFTSIGGSTNSVRNLILINTAIFILTWWVFPKEQFFQYFALFNISDINFAVWQPFTNMFLHAGFLHILFNMIVLWSFGNTLEQNMGTKKFLTLYFLSGLTSSIFWMFLGTGPATSERKKVKNYFETEFIKSI